MKKTLLSLACLGMFVGGLDAQNLEFRYDFDDSYSFDFAYKNYNNKNNLVFGGKINYKDHGKDSYSLSLEGLAGQNLYLKQDGYSTFGINLLGGLSFWRFHYEIPGYEKNKNMYGPTALLNISGVYDKSIIYSADFQYITYFGDQKDHFLRYDFGAGYKFTKNFYAKANILFSTQGESEKNKPNRTYLGFTLGYEF